MPTKEQYERNKDYYKRLRSKWRQTMGRDAWNKYQNEYYKNHKERMKWHAWKGRLKQKYGMTPEMYDGLKKLQGGVCAICKRDTKRRLAVDHDHSTGIVRGLLCDSCNTKLGWFEKYREIAELYVLKGYKSWNAPNKS